MTVDKPTPGNLIATVSELVDAENAGGGGGAIFDSYMLLGGSPGSVPSGGGLVSSPLALALSNGSDMTYDGTSGITFNTHGIYSVSLQAQWNLTSGESGTRRISSQITGGGFPTIVSFTQLGVGDVVGGIPGTDASDHLIQTISVTGEIEAAVNISTLYENGDGLNASSLASYAMFAVRIA